MLRWEEEALCQSFCNYFTTKAKFARGFYYWVVKSRDHLGRRHHVSQALRCLEKRVGKGQKPWANLLAKTVDEIIINPTPAQLLQNFTGYSP